MHNLEEDLIQKIRYTKSFTRYNRRDTVEVNIGDVPLGANHPIRVQSMTTVDTMDTKGSVEQTLRMVESGCEYVRITAPSIKEAENLRAIRDELRKRGCKVPLVADIHFTPNAAELAARIVEKVRINPGNYADKKKFEEIEYTDNTYNRELDRIRDKFTPLVKICKEYGTAMRIGTNHGSLSDRIMSRYGDTPIGMVESALEFLRICENESFYNIVISMKSSNPQVMVQAYRLLVQKLVEENLKPYPLHLGVTEAGEAEDGRIKSALGIGTLLEEGLGDTVRVSLTEEPEVEAPVGRLLVDRLKGRVDARSAVEGPIDSFDPFAYQRRTSEEVLNVGHTNVPRVISDLSAKDKIEVPDLKAIGHFYLPELDKWTMNDLGTDYLYSGSSPVQFMLPNGLKEIIDYDVWIELGSDMNKLPLVRLNQLVDLVADQPAFLSVSTTELSTEWLTTIKTRRNLVLILKSDNQNAYLDLRNCFLRFRSNGINHPVVVHRTYPNLGEDAAMMYPSTDIGGLFIDGFGDGLMISSDTSAEGDLKRYNQTAFGILQAARVRITKTEYISCPSCGRTLFDLQETTTMIRKRTDHLKGVKIGIMGCIVNGPGEMADADYGYVGSGKGKITLYKGKEVMKRGVPSESALDELIELIKEDGKWVEPKTLIEA